MKRKLFLVIGIFIFTIGQNALCFADEITPGLEQSLKQPVNEPNFLTIIFSLLFVVFLIYITGIIYSKLNLVGAKTVQEQLKNYDLARAVVISTTQLGQGKNLHVIEINNKRYLIGATPNSINLIKELGDAKKVPAKAQEPIVEENVDDAIEVLYGEEQKKLNEELEKVEEFDVHKKYL